MVVKDGITQTNVKRVFQSYSGHLKLFKRATKTFVHYKNGCQGWYNTNRGRFHTFFFYFFFEKRVGGWSAHEVAMLSETVGKFCPIKIQRFILSEMKRWS